jgi:transposase
LSSWFANLVAVFADPCPSGNQPAALVRRQADRIVQLEETVARQADLIAELQRRLGADSSSSSKPPSSDPPWAKPAPKRSSRTRSERKPGKQPSESGSSRSLADNPNHTVPLEPPAAAAAGRR